MLENNSNTPGAYAALKIADFRSFIYARFFLVLGIQMQSVIVGWQVYAITHDPLSLGLIGLSEAIPFFAIALFAGHIADKVDRKKIIVSSNLVYFICAGVLLFISTNLNQSLVQYKAAPIYAVIFITGIARGFMSPSQTAFAAQLIPRELYGNASTWNSVTWQVAEVAGPAIGGLVYGFLGVAVAYTIVVIFSLTGLVFFSVITSRPVPVHTTDENIWQSLSSGLKFVWKNQMILSAISLDMFAVFFGGAVSMLPIFADQILHTGAKGLGFLRAAPAAGAIIMSVFQAHRPVFKKAGKNLLICVFGFGICIILFALSRNFYLSIFILLLSGMFDNVSVVIRATILQLFTPDEMRGRVSAVNSIFIGSSNELGSFESGVAARLMGLIPSVIFGGSMTLITVMGINKLIPKLKKLSF